MPGFFQLVSLYYRAAGDLNASLLRNSVAGSGNYGLYYLNSVSTNCCPRFCTMTSRYGVVPEGGEENPAIKSLSHPALVLLK